MLRLKLKLHLFDLLWICCATCCTKNLQQIEPVQLELEAIFWISWTLHHIRVVFTRSSRCTSSFHIVRLIACSHGNHTADTDKTKLSCLVSSVSAVWTELLTRQDSLVSSRPSFDEFCLVSTQIPICNCSVSDILRTTENLEMGNWVETRDKTVLSCLQLCSHRQSGQDKTV